MTDRNHRATFLPKIAMKLLDAPSWSSPAPRVPTCCPSVNCPAQSDMHFPSHSGRTSVLVKHILSTVPALALLAGGSMLLVTEPESRVRHSCKIFSSTTPRRNGPFHAFRGGSDTRSSTPSFALHRWFSALLILITIALSLSMVRGLGSQSLPPFHLQAEGKLLLCLRGRRTVGGVVAFTREGVN